MRQNPKDIEKDDGMDNAVNDAYIKEAAKAVSYLSPGDFKKMAGLKVPVEAEDGESVKVIITGEAKGGFLVDPVGAECVPGEYEEEEDGESKSKGRIRIMISGGDKEEE